MKLLRNPKISSFSSADALVVRDLLARFPDNLLDRSNARSYDFQRSFIESAKKMKRWNSTPSLKQLTYMVDILRFYKAVLPAGAAHELGFDSEPETQDARLCRAIQDITTVEPKSKLWWDGFRNSLKGATRLSENQKKYVLIYLSNYRRQCDPELVEEFSGILPQPDEFLCGLTQEYLDLLVDVSTFLIVSGLSNDKELKAFASNRGVLDSSEAHKKENTNQVKLVSEKLAGIAQKNELLESVHKFIVSPALFNSQILTRAIAIQKEYEDAGSQKPDIEDVKETACNEITSQFKAGEFYPASVKAACHKALQMLAGVCDYASSDDDCGFNKPHSALGHKLAEKYSEIPDIYMPFALHCVKFYKRQLGSMILEEAGIGGEDLELARMLEKRRAKKAGKKEKKESDVSDAKNALFWSLPFGKYFAECIGVND